MMNPSTAKFKPGDRVWVRIAQRADVARGDEGTVIEVREGFGGDCWYVDVILDSGVRMGNYHEAAFFWQEGFCAGL